MALNFVAIDIETANQRWDSICSVALVRIDNGEIAAEYSTLINPECDFHPMNIHVHGITQSMVADAPIFKEIANDILDFIGDDILISHNIVFDANVLQRDFIRYECPLNDIRTFCTLACAKAYKPSLLNYKLPTLCAEYGIELSHHHDALSDARACAFAMIAMAKSMCASSIDEAMERLCITNGIISSSEVISPRSTARQSLYGPKSSDAQNAKNPFQLLEDLKNANPDIANEIEMSQLKDARNIAFKCADGTMFNYTIGRASTYIKVSDLADPTTISPYTSRYKDGSIKINIDSNFNYGAFLEAASAIARDIYNASASTVFGCCNDFIRCSDALRCLKTDNPDYRGCQYRKNLESGRVFYGANAGISMEEYEARKKAFEAQRKKEKIGKRTMLQTNQKNRLSSGRPILQMKDDGTLIKLHPSIATAVRDTGISSKSIRDAANGVQKHAGGFCWKYADQD